MIIILLAMQRLPVKKNTVISTLCGFKCSGCSKRDRNRSRMRRHVSTCHIRHQLPSRESMAENKNEDAHNSSSYVSDARVSTNKIRPTFIERDEFSREVTMLKSEIENINKSPKRETKLKSVNKFIRNSIEDIQEELMAIISAQVFKSLPQASPQFLIKRQHIIKSNLLSICGSINFQNIAEDHSERGMRMKKQYPAPMIKQQHRELRLLQRYNKDRDEDREH